MNFVIFRQRKIKKLLRIYSLEIKEYRCIITIVEVFENKTTKEAKQ